MLSKIITEKAYLEYISNGNRSNTVFGCVARGEDVYEETEAEIQLFVGASDLSLEWEPKGFKHTGYEEWTKWVPKSECEKFDEIIEY